MIQVGIIGATGYTGQELIRLLHNHPETEISVLTSQSYDGKPFSSIYGNALQYMDKTCENLTIEEAAERCDVLFVALPHGIASHQVSDSLLATCKVIDLGADYRLKDQGVYEQWYKTGHGSPELLGEAVYGLCELYREEIAGARLIANPGCYTTCSILSLTPLVSDGLIDTGSIIIDAKSGVSGAGRKASTATLYGEVNESIKAYGVASHRHTPEIEEQLSRAAGTPVTLSFTPHLVPMNRGILVTAYASLKEGVTLEMIETSYRAHYGNERFIRLLQPGTFPETRWVKGSNICDIGFTVDQRTGRVIVSGAIDNLVKGASGQAVQNMNIICGLPEETGLDLIPGFPM